MSQAIRRLAPLAATLAAGCGTFSDYLAGPINDDVYYRGVRLDLKAIQEKPPLYVKALLAADIPFSAVADTLMLPFLAVEDIKSGHQKKSRMMGCNLERLRSSTPARPSALLQCAAMQPYLPRILPLGNVQRALIIARDL